MRLIRQITCFVFASMVLFSSSYLMVGLHICSGSVQHMALFSKAEGCEMEKKMPPCHRHESKPCCEDTTITHEGQTYNISTHKIVIPFAPLVDTIQPAVLISEVIPSIVFSTPNYADYSPPLPTQDLNVSLSTFLI